MRFVWNQVKNQKNVEKHGVDFADAIDIFNHPMLELMDARDDYDEDRWISIGLIRGLVGVVIYTERHDDVIRIISARKATKHEVRRYEQRVKN